MISTSNRRRGIVGLTAAILLGSAPFIVACEEEPQDSLEDAAENVDEAVDETVEDLDG